MSRNIVFSTIGSKNDKIFLFSSYKKTAAMRKHGKGNGSTFPFKTSVMASRGTFFCSLNIREIAIMRA
jgi:hypothetical protein